MKKILCSFITIVMLTLSTISPTNAQSPQEDLRDAHSSSITYNDDGSYFVTTVEIISSSRATAQTVSGIKNVHLYNSSDELVWTHTIVGTFTLVKGVSVQCTNSTYSSTIYDDSWSLTAHDNYYSGNIAYGTATYKKKVLFITTNTYDVNAGLKCDVNGNFS